MFEIEKEESNLENPTELENVDKERKRFHLNNFHLLDNLSTAYCECERNHCQLSRITPVSSQVLTVFYNSMPINITLDSGATTSFITEKLCQKLKITISPNHQLARLGDGCTVIASVGEIDILLTRSTWSVRFRAIVVKTLNTDIYGGMTFLTDNDISMRPKTGEIKINNKHTIFQTNMIMPAPTLKALGTPSSTTVSLNVLLKFYFLHKNKFGRKPMLTATLTTLLLPHQKIKMKQLPLGLSSPWNTIKMILWL